MWTNIELRQVKRALRGDRVAGEEIVAKHYPSVLRLLTYLGLPRDEAEEITQETFASAWTSLGTFTGKSSLRTWLHRIAYRQYCKRREPSIQLGDSDLVDQRQDFANSVLDAIAIERAISQLPEVLRVPLLLVHVLQLSTKDAAEILGIPQGTILSRLHTAKERLRRTLTIREAVNVIPISHSEAPDPKFLEAL